MIVDSLKQEVELSEQIDSLIDAAILCWRDKPQVSMEKALRAESLARSPVWGIEGDQRQIARALVQQAYAAIGTADFSKGLELGSSAEIIAVAINMPSVLAESLAVKGHAYMRMTNLPKAQDCYQRQLKIGRETNNEEQILKALSGLCTVFGESEDYESGIKYAEKALALSDTVKMQDPAFIGGCYNNLSVLYGYTGRPEKGLKYGLQGLELVQADQNSLRVALLLSVAIAYRDLEQFDNALMHYGKALSVLEDVPNAYFRAVTLFDIAETHFILGNFTESQQVAISALALAVECANRWHQSKCHKLLSRLAQQRDEFPLALDHYKQFHQLKDDAVGEKNATQMRLLRASYDVDLSRLESELYQLRNVELEKQVAARTRDLELALDRERSLGQNLSDALKQSQAAHELRSRIVTTVSHEFRTPLTVINTASDLLANHSANMPQAKQLRLHQRVKDAVASITALLQDVVLVDSVDQAGLAPELAQITINELVDSLEKSARMALNHAERLRFTIDPVNEARSEIYTDTALVENALLPILSNALKYSSSSSRVDICISTQGEQLLIAVSDTGIGVLAQEREQIFDLLTRGSNVDARRGLGMGLYITRTTAAALGGTVSAETHNGTTTFTLRIPLNPATA